MSGLTTRGFHQPRKLLGLDDPQAWDWPYIGEQLLQLDIHKWGYMRKSFLF